MYGKNKNFNTQIIYVIIAAYNCQNFIKESVSSVLHQDGLNLRVIIVDDGSTDKTPEVSDMLAKNDNRVRVLHKVNGGVSSARNVGIEYVQSVSDDADYIAFLDADDAWPLNFFDQTVQTIVEKRVDLIGFQSATCNSELTMRSGAIDLKEGEYSSGNQSVWIHAAQHFGAMLYSCNFIRKYHIRFMEKLRYSEDKIFSMHCLYLANRIILKNKLLYLYRQNEASAMNTRQFGIPYFVPIIDGYLNSDSEMLKYQNDERGRLDQGHALAMVYIMDMIEEHYQQFGNTRDIKKLFFDKPLYQEIYNEGLEQKEKRYMRYHTRPYSFIIRNYMLGIRNILMRAVLKIKFIRRFKERRLFNIKLEDYD